MNNSNAFPLLCVDTSSHTFHLALASAADSWVFRHSEFVSSQRSHSAILVPTLQQKLQETGLKLESVKTIAVGLGPGSFTGLRASVCTVRALAQALPTLKVVGLNRFEMLASALTMKEPKITGRWQLALDARRGQVYAATATFESGHLLRMSEPALLPWQQCVDSTPDGWCLEDSLIAQLPDGEGCGCAEPLIKVERLEPLIPEAMAVCVTAGKAPTPYQQLAPLYLQQPNITLKKR